MLEFIHSGLVGGIAVALEEDLEKASTDARFPCRPAVGRTAEGGTVLGRFHGSIGLPNLSQFKTALNELVQENLVKLVLDFATASLSPSAVGVFVDFAAAVLGRGKKLYLYRPSAQVRGRLKELDIAGFFTVLETEDDLVAAFVV